MPTPNKTARWRSKLGLTQREAAAELGVTQAYVSQLENAERELPPALHREMRRIAAWRDARSAIDARRDPRPCRVRRASREHIESCPWCVALAILAIERRGRVR